MQEDRRQVHRDDSLVVQVLGAPGSSTLATAQVVVADSLLPPAVLSLGPANGASGLNAGTAVSETFNKAMDSTSVAAHLKLYSGPNLVGGAFRTPVNGMPRVRMWREYPKGARRGMSDFL
jgi:hypothetical protein